MQQSFKITQLEDWNVPVKYSIEERKDHKIILLNGNLGAGKTTFAKYFCAYFGLPIHGISSPTFSIVNTHQVTEKKIHHFDLYRIKNTEELLDIGFEDYLYSQDYCLIEWPDIALSLIPKKHLEVNITVHETYRIVQINSKN
jgi:tRNA threonylcarbamoyladenosine biosynthesis protein TsaE